MIGALAGWLRVYFRIPRLLDGGFLMSKANGPLRVSPSELRMTAEQLDGQAGGFAEKRQGAHARVSGAALGSGQAAA